MNTTPATPLLDSLPQGFDFYHLGRIELSDAQPAADLASGRYGVAFSFEGDLRGALALLVDEGLDASTYSEAGNIIASRMASRLSDQHGLDVAISPPRLLNQSQLRSLLDSGDAIVRTYIHQPGQRAITLQAVILGEGPGAKEIGNA